MVASCHGNGKGNFTEEIFLVNISDTQDEIVPAYVLCQWRLLNSTMSGKGKIYFHTADVHLQILPPPDQSKVTEGLAVVEAKDTVLETLVRKACNLAPLDSSRERIALKLILVPHDGYLCRNDILKIRLQDAELVDNIISLSTWGQQFQATGLEPNNLFNLLQSCPGGLVVDQSHFFVDEDQMLLQKDLTARLSFDWVSEHRPVARKVGVVGGRSMCDKKQGMYGSQGFFEAAQALGVSIIVFDEPGHWLQDESYAHLRDEFIAMDMSNLTTLPQKMAQVLKSRCIDGIVTFTDDFVIATAEAAELLGFPTESSSAMKQAHYKHEMRRLVNKTNIQAVHLDSADQLEDSKMVDTINALQYPLIVKPSRGLLSKGVKKVTNDESMRQAIRMLERDGLTEQGILIETYVDGPELDANFVLWDDQILFLEVTDNMPCLGDASGATLADNFTETVQISSSGLPHNEIKEIRTSLHESLLRLGFHSGVFHVEARMQCSSMQYKGINDAGAVDLSPRAINHGDMQKPEVFLIEVNAREPGTAGTWATLYTYGVDLGALQLLRALGDRERFQALSKPFSFPEGNPGGGGGAQYWTAHCIIPVHRESVFVPEDFFDKVYQLCPDIVPHVSRAELYAESGRRVSLSAGTGWMAYLLLYSRTSRRHVLKMYHLAAEASKVVLDAASGYD
ncbi:hypothetical protein VTL71DRAFT_8487 [Oculimacula yallundae]|uniref:ATP-grasp domain-containing protein n=1 Tax=Oculimacula yallundae TaxID=86028 RepID=A0ABR4CZ92_9HELO